MLSAVLQFCRCAPAYVDRQRQMGETVNRDPIAKNRQILSHSVDWE